MRVVLDTNIVISALLWRGTPYRLFEFLNARAETSIASSTPLIEELARVLTRPSMSRRLASIGTGAAAIMQSYLTVVSLVTPAEIAPICRDVDDDMVLATALAARANLINSGDDDLLSLRRWQDIDIVTAAEALVWKE